MRPDIWCRDIANGRYDEQFSRLYHDCETDAQKKRYTDALACFEQEFGNGRDVELFSAPGRTELCGNHTDHQRGRVLAAAVTMDKLAIVAKRTDNMVTVVSQGYNTDRVDISDLEVKQQEANTSKALIRGTAAGFALRGHSIGGFDAFISSNVLKGAGLSSSAAFEVVIGTIMNHLFNAGAIGAVEIAQIGQYAENVFFQKPCGLMDQTASSVGGIVAIDFLDQKNPQVQKIDLDFSVMGYTLFIADAGGSHADLSHEYAAIPAEMKSVAACFGKDVLREVDREAFYKTIGELRGKVTDRALLRSIHYFEEDMRVQEQTQALLGGSIERYKALMISSGRSSAMNLQNIYPVCDINERSVALALAASEQILEGRGAWRIHGGGFAGTILALVPNGLEQTYVQPMERIFGAGCCHALYVRPVGGYMFEKEGEARSG